MSGDLKFVGDYIVSRLAATLPQTAQTPYFNITGKVQIIEIIGEAIAASAAGANTLGLWWSPATGGADVALCGVVDSDPNTIGNKYTITGTVANAMVKTLIDLIIPNQATPLILGPGTIDLKTSASKAGTTIWSIKYVPLTSDGLITVL